MVETKTRERKMLGEKPGRDQLFIKQTKRGRPTTIKEALAGMKGGEARTGFLGEGNIVRKPDTVAGPEQLDKEGIARKRAVQSLLTKIVTPNSLGNKATPEMDKRSFVSKLNRRTLEELNRLLPVSVEALTTIQMEQVVSGQADISDQEKADMQILYQDVSP